MSKVDVSVVIPVWNGRPYLEACLEALLAQVPGAFRLGEGRVEVLLVDNASSDGSADWVEDHYPQVKLIRNPVNRGFGGACNAGIKAATGQTLVLLNQDTRVYPAWLAALSDALTDARVGVAGCKALYPDGETIQHAGGRIKWPVAMAEHYGVGERDAGQWDTRREVDYVTGAAMAFRRDLLDQIGLLDETFWPGYYEDCDFCYRARQAGYEVWYVPEALLTHEESPSLRGKRDLSMAFHRGRLRFVVKHLPPQRFLDEFVPAERAAYLGHARDELALALRMAYVGAVSAVATLYPVRWQAEASVTDAAIKALQQLFQLPIAEVELFEPTLAEFEFRSKAPVLGGLVARVRALWFSVAAKWAMRYLSAQQEAINHQVRALLEQQQANDELYIHSLVSLSEDVARLTMQLKAQDKKSGIREVSPEAP